MSQSFSELPLREELQKNLVSLQYTAMTAIQAEALPVALNDVDVIAQAKTGSGKTAVFSLAILNKLNVEDFSIQALILCPTRELADQVALSLRRYARLMPNVKILNLSGGMPTRPQLDSLSHGAHIVVGTPGRVLKHLDLRSVRFNKLLTLVLDEADRMLDMGFYDDIESVISRCPRGRQTLLFSATFPDEIRQLAKKFMRAPKEIIAEVVPTENDIEQRFYKVANQGDKYPLLKSLLLHYQPSSALIFCTTKSQTVELSEMLIRDGFSAAALNGDMEQFERDVAVIHFANKSCSFLVATDVAARGLDIKELPAVINYDLALDQDVHTHRIGRTGRAKSKGLALSIILPSDGERLRALESQIGGAVIWGECSELAATGKIPPSPEMATLCIQAGKRDKVRAGDILGALTQDAGLPGDAVGKINVTDNYSYVAVRCDHSEKAYRYFQNGKLKGRKVRLRMGS